MATYKLKEKSREVWTIWNMDIRSDTYMDWGVEMVNEVSSKVGYHFIFEWISKIEYSVNWW